MNDGVNCFPGRVGNSTEDVGVCIEVARSGFKQITRECHLSYSF